MKQNVSEYDFIDGFMKIRPDNFSRNGLQCLYDYFIELEDDIGEEIEFDVIAICCDFTEYKDFNEIQEAYDVKGLTDYDVKEWLDNNTIWIECNNSIIIRQF
tara:strand:- start:392 stop:697 length:306 start_codon:yes stop_codon:yes gene_type:complete